MTPSADSLAVPPAICFVVMPFGESGTPENDKFTAIYSIIKSRVETQGLECRRADSTRLPGNITREIVTQLAQSNLVVADLSDLNPNVFYELGVRHALRRRGTLLIMNEQEKSRTPFDVSQYRILWYADDLLGGVRLASDLDEVLAELQTSEKEAVSDSPVHDWFPQLPFNVIASAPGNIDASIIAELGDARKQLERYRKSSLEASQPGLNSAGSQGTIELIEQLKRQTRSGELPDLVFSRAKTAVEKGDLNDFLAAAGDFLQAPGSIDKDRLIQFARWAKKIGLDELEEQILLEAGELFQDDGDILRRSLYRLTRSKNSSRSNSAIKRIADLAGINLETGTVHKAGVKPVSGDIGFVVQALHEQGKDDLGMSIIDSAISHSSNKRDTELHRYRARQLEWLGDASGASEAFRNLTASSDASQEIYRWLGNNLHNSGMHTDALEVFTLDAFMDIEDPSAYTMIGGEIGFALFDPFSLGKQSVVDSRALPTTITVETALRSFAIAAQCQQATASDQEKLVRAAARCGYTARDINGEIENGFNISPEYKFSILRWLYDLYVELKSPLTDQSFVGQRLISLHEDSP